MALISKVNLQKISLLMGKPWVLPIALSVLINFVGIGLVYLLDYKVNDIYLLFIKEEKQHMILNVIASSLITLIGVTFSISMLILSTVSNQFGPRLLPNFLNSKNTQMTLGFFLGTFVFSLYCIYAESNGPVRGVQTTYAFLLAISCLFMLVFFINNVMKSIQINEILNLIFAETQSAIKSLFLNINTKNGRCVRHAKKTDKVSYICAEKNGYIQGIDYAGLKKLAMKHQLSISVLVRPGEFIYAKNTLLKLSSHKQNSLTDVAKNSFRSSINIMRNRLLEQDIEYGFEQISEIAVRALSPGINDPYTARECVYLLGELLLFIEKYPDLEACELVEEDKIYVIFNPLNYERMVESGFNRLRQASLSDLTVILAIYDMSIQLLGLLKNKKLIKPLLMQVKTIHEMVQKQQFSEHDQEALTERYEKLEKFIKKFQV